MSWVMPVISAAGSLVAGGLNYLGGKQTNKANVASAESQMEFQERMSSTAYQRATDDMRKAGLNPMLAYSQGGASAPTGASLQQQNPATGAVSSALETAMMFAQIGNMKTQNKILEAQYPAIASGAKVETEINESGLKMVHWLVNKLAKSSGVVKGLLGKR